MTDATDVVLDIGGMTCAACANRVERKLNKLPGVEASVNYATEKARVLLAQPLPTQQLIATVEAAGYTASLPSSGPKADPTKLLRIRLLVSLVLAVPVVALSMIPVLQFDGWQWVAFALAAPVALWGAWPFHRAAAVNARHGAASMDTLISIGVLAAFLWSAWALLFGGAGEIGMRMVPVLFGASEGAELYLEVAAAVPVFVLAGRYAEAKARRRSGEALRALLELGAKDATLLRDGVERQVPVSALVPGDIVLARPGQTIPSDGVVVDGASAVDASMMTGESVPVEVARDARVVGGTINVGGVLQIQISRVGADTELARLARLVEEAQTGKAAVQRLADRVSAVFVPVVLVLALLALAGWFLVTGSLEQSLAPAVATLIIACPCALGLATPTALLVGTGRGAQLGILIRGPQVLEQTRRIDTVVLDKTGTLTSGRMRVVASPSPEVLRLAAAAEHGSEHPIGRAIAAAVPDAPVASEFRAHAGVGVEASVLGQRVVVGRPSGAVSEAEERGSTAVIVTVDGVDAGVIELADTPKPGAAEAVRRLRALGLTPVLLTGDNDGAARRVADELGIDDVRARVTPAGKLDVIRSLQSEGRVVAMVGDGVNDSAALAAADLGIAMGGGTDAAIAASDLTVVGDDPRAIADAVRLARATLGVIRGNLFWAFAYNVAAIPVAMLGLLNPALAAAAMAFSSVFVVTNSLRLRSFRAG